MNRSDEIKDLVAALCLAQPKFQKAVKDKENTFFKVGTGPNARNAKYANLESVWEACKTPLAEHGLAVSQFPVGETDRMGVETLLFHSSGQWISHTCLLPLGEKKTPQSAGSAITYARRYALGALLGICTENDDDGNLASGNSSSPQTAAGKVEANFPKGGRHRDNNENQDPPPGYEPKPPDERKEAPPPHSSDVVDGALINSLAARFNKEFLNKAQLQELRNEALVRLGNKKAFAECVGWQKATFMSVIDEVFKNPLPPPL